MKIELTEREAAWLRKELKWHVNWNKTRMIDRPAAERVGVKIGAIKYRTRLMQSIIDKLGTP